MKKLIGIVLASVALFASCVNTGNWSDDGKTITRTWSDKSVDVLYYTFNTDVSEMTLSSAPNGLSTTYARSK